MTELDYKPHPFSEIFPICDGDQLYELADHIKGNGLHHPGLLFEGQLIDGRRRQLACKRAGVKFRVKEFKGSRVEALAFVYGENFHRRHLGTGDRAMVAARYLQTSRDISTQVVDGAQECAPTTQQVAEQFNVSRRSIQNAQDVLKNGTPELQKAVADGTVTITDAAAVATEPPKVQDAAVAAVRKGRAPTARKAVTQRKEKSGKPIWDDRPFHSHVGKLTRFLDGRKKAFGAHKEYDFCTEHLGLIVSGFRRWIKATS